VVLIALCFVGSCFSAKSGDDSKNNQLVISLVQSVLTDTKGTEGYVKVRIADAQGNYAGKFKVFLVKAFPSADEGKFLIRNQEIFPIEGEKTLYHFNFFVTKPEPGFYTLEFRATPEEKGNANGVESSIHTLKNPWSSRHQRLQTGCK